MTPADKPELVAGYYRCTESRTKLFTVGTAYEVYRYEPDGRATVITNLDTDVTLPHPEATLEPYDPWGRPTKPTRPTSDLAEQVEGLVGKVDAHLNAAEALLQNPNDTALKVISRVLLELAYARSANAAILAALKEVNSHDRT